MLALAEFQAEFAVALLNPDTSLRHALGAGLTIHQNTVMRGLIDALRANYSTVERLVGVEWFESVARLYAIAHLPCEPSLALYGEHFADFLQPFAAVHEMVYLPPVAQLDRQWLEACFALDASPLQAKDLQQYSPEQLSTLQLHLHPATRFDWLPHSAVTIWQANRDRSQPESALEVVGDAEGVLITRVQGELRVVRMDQVQWLFMQHLQQGLTLGAAALQILQQWPQADVAAMLAWFINAGAVVATDNHY